MQPTVTNAGNGVGIRTFEAFKKRRNKLKKKLEPSKHARKSIRGTSKGDCA